jgi:hypothetical protein
LALLGCTILKAAGQGWFLRDDRWDKPGQWE